MFSNFGTTEILIIAVILFFLFGGRKLPELAKGIAEAFKELKKSLKDKE